jgi:DNA-directed RNA polymerase I subunit RPA1
MDANRDFAEFEFDEKNGQWCHMRLEYPAESPKILVLSLVEAACHSAVIHAVPGIGSCALSTGKRRDPASGAEVEEPVAVTQGVNVAAMQQFPAEIDVDRLSTNDIHSMLRFYGVESCRATIIREMDTVFRSHGIVVDQRHINLIADAMTRAGTFQPFSRKGIQCSSSPLLKMSFETTTAFLRDAVLDADRDDLLSPSARLVVGKVSRAGTGAFDVLMPLQVGFGDSPS